jgi:hypothetical protein
MRCGHATLDSSTSRRLCYSWPLSPGKGMHIFAFSCQTRYRIASHLYPCTLPSAHQSGTKSEAHNLAACRACLPEHRTSNIEHRLDLTCLAHDPTHMQLRVCSPARLSGGSVWVGFINGMVWPGRLASFVEERRRRIGTTTTMRRRQQQQQQAITTKSTSTSTPHQPTVHTLLSRPSRP